MQFSLLFFPSFPFCRPDHATELMIGVLALICISITIVACACCHRNKSGFEVSILSHKRIMFKCQNHDNEKKNDRRTRLGNTKKKNNKFEKKKPEC